MKRRLVIIGTVIICILAGGLFTLHILMGLSIKQNIKLAQQKYSGTVEDALISYMMDENISAEGRTHEAIWTLGKVRSEKALPYLKDLYRNDPKGKTCYGKHDQMLCQYEIHKAIVAIERRGLISYARLNK
jgi:hypothetical protein